MIRFTKKEVDVLVDAMSYPVGSIAARGCWHVWDYWAEHRGNRYWNSASWNSTGQIMNRQDREMLRYLTVKGTCQCL